MNTEILKFFTDEQLNNIAKLSAEDIRDMFVNELERRENERAKFDEYKINVGDCWLSIDSDNDVIRVKYINKFEDDEYTVTCYDIIHNSKDVDLYDEYFPENCLQEILFGRNYTKIEPSIIGKMEELADAYNRRVEELNTNYYNEIINILNLED